MVWDAFHERSSLILSIPPELQAYQQWLEAQRVQESRDYLFTEDRARFEPRKEDVVSVLPGLSVGLQRKKTVLHSSWPRREVAVDGVNVKEAERILDAIDGKRTLLEVKWDSGVSPPCFAKFLRASFGWVVFASEAVGSLENQLSGIEITRFPTIPYGIERAYWQNMIDVRKYALLHLESIDSTSAIKSLLRQLHVLALMGKSLNSFYKPASPIADQRVAPGAFYLDAPRLLERDDRVIFLDGPRVNVSLLGGKPYHEALYASLDDEEALASSRGFHSEGVDWGRFVTARSEKDESFRPWFCPPRPITEAHWDKLAWELMDARKAVILERFDEAIDKLASFHQAFVRLHPFHCANQSVAMNLVNGVLGMFRGVGIPHLVLDHLALRLSEKAYQRVFSRAVGAYGFLDSDAATRLREFMGRKTKFFSLVEAMGKVQTESELAGVLRADPEGAGLALLSDDVGRVSQTLR